MNCHTYKYLLVSLLGLVLAFTFYSINPVAAQEEPQFNILWQREAHIKSGKQGEAIQYVRELIAYEKNKLPQSKKRVYLEILGDVGKIYWMSEHKDFATMARDQRQLMEDPGYRAILNKAVGLFIEGSVHDTVMLAIP